MLTLTPIMVSRENSKETAMKNYPYVILVAVLVAAFSINAQANPRGPGFGGPGFGIPDPAMMLEHMADHLDLDDSQRATIENIVEAVRPEAEALREQFRANREALHALDASDPAYETTLNNLAMSQGQLATEGVLLATRIRTEIHAVLTDEQLEKLERGKRRMKKRIEQRFGGDAS
jgi:Spy/CpxP family protein refolding chaperone